MTITKDDRNSTILITCETDESAAAIVSAICDRYVDFHLTNSAESIHQCHTFVSVRFESSLGLDDVVSYISSLSEV